MSAGRYIVRVFGYDPGEKITKFLQQELAHSPAVAHAFPNFEISLTFSHEPEVPLDFTIEVVTDLHVREGEVTNSAINVGWFLWGLIRQEFKFRSYRIRKPNSQSGLWKKVS